MGYCLNERQFWHLTKLIVCFSPMYLGLEMQKSQNHLGQKRSLTSSSSTINLALPSVSLNHVPKCHTYMPLFKYIQGWWLHPSASLSSLFQFLTTLLVKKFFLISSLTSCCLREETDTHLTPSSCQAVVKRGKLSPQPPFLQSKKPKFPQLLL